MRIWQKRALFCFGKRIFHLTSKKVVAKIYPENTRSVRSALSCGFVCTRNDSRLHTSALANDFFDRRKNKLAPPARENIRKTLRYAGILFVKGR